MCGRFVQRYTWDDIQDLYELPEGPARNLQAHYNVAPTDPVNVVKLAAGGTTELVSMRWGLVPWWWKKPLKQLPASFNARAESVVDKPMFRDAFKRHRCISHCLPGDYVGHSHFQYHCLVEDILQSRLQRCDGVVNVCSNS